MVKLRYCPRIQTDAKVETMSQPSDSSFQYQSSATLKESLPELLGLARGLLADEILSNDEIEFLHHWLEQHHAVKSSFPGNIIHDRISEVLADGVITEDERSHLVVTLNLLIENRLDELKDEVELTELWFDDVAAIKFDSTLFCLTGNFVYGPLDQCKKAIEKHGGFVSASVAKELDFLVIGGLGVDEWRHGGLGKEIETAIKLRKESRRVKIIHEDLWASQLPRAD